MKQISFPEHRKQKINFEKLSGEQVLIFFKLVHPMRAFFCIFCLIYSFFSCFEQLFLNFTQFVGGTNGTGKLRVSYCIYSINRPGRLLNFWTLRVGAYSWWAFIRGWALIKFSPFSASVVVYFTTKQ